jgi:SAM-dependent methyltransferase
MTTSQSALLAIGRALKADKYAFVAPTPLTCSRILSRPARDDANVLTEVFGWNRRFRPGELGGPYEEALLDGGLCEPVPGGLRSLVRFSSVGELLFVHSGFPTDQPDAVFFGPDTYRFVRAIKWLSDSDSGFLPKSVIDVGAGTGAGGIYSAALFGGVQHAVLADINAKALEYAEVNAALNGIAADIRQSDVLAQVDRDADLIISNPPYLVDRGRRAYRHGGGDWGCALAVRIVDEALGKLTEAGRLLLYTGTPVVNGADKFLEAVRPLLDRKVRDFHYEELDPDVFGEELENAPYDHADRIATAVLHVNAADVIR